MLFKIYFLLITLVLGERKGRIVGGLSVDPPFKYPWMVAIFRYGEYSCGATLLKRNFVITAAHCIGGAFGPLDTFEVQIHRHDLDESIVRERGKAFKVIKRWVADDYDRDLKYNDLAILKISSRVSLKSDVQIDHLLYHRDGLMTSVLGWGAVRPRGRFFPVLQEVRLPLIPQSECVKAYEDKVGYEVEETQFCAGYKRGGKDACQGDSGGPLIIFKNKVPVLVGIVSSGLVCAAPGEPGLYVRVASYRQWIEDVVAGKVPPTPTLELY